MPGYIFFAVSVLPFPGDMQFFPSKHFYLSTPLDPDRLLERLQENVEPRQKLRMYFPSFEIPDHKLYEGTVRNGQFCISCIPERDNVFLPVIEGKIISSRTAATTLDIRMYVRQDIRIVTIVWLSLSVVAGIFMIVMQQVYPLLLLPLITLVLNIPFMYGVFTFYAKKNRQQLVEFLAAHEVAPEDVMGSLPDQ